MMGHLLYVAFFGVAVAARLPLFLRSPRYSGLAPTDNSVNPCRNFYEHCCNPWTVHTEKPPSEPIWNPWIAVGHEIKRRIAKILTHPDPTLTTPRIFYRSCMGITARETKYFNDLISLVDDLGGWPLTKGKWEKPSYNWLDHLATISRNLGIHPILKIHPDLDYENPTQYALYLEPGDLIYPHYILANSDYGAEMEAYEKWILETVRHLYDNRTNHATDSAVKAIIKFETLLARIVDNNKTKNERLTVGKLSQKFSFDFLEPLNIMFRGYAEINNATTIMVKNYTYLKNLFILIKKSRSRVVADYLIWAVIKDLSRDTTTYMRKLNFLVDRAILGVQDDLSREHECANKIIEFFSPALVPRYLKSYTEPQTLALVTSMVASIKTEFVNVLMKNDWLSNETKLQSVEKVKNIKLHLGFPRWFLNENSVKSRYHSMQITRDYFLNILTLKKSKMAENLSRLGKKATVALWPSTPFDVNAYYSILQNSIFIPLGLLEPPFFDPHRLQVYNYGALGSLIGHELSHSLDPVGILADQTGKIAEWWPDGDLALYKTRIQCFKRNRMTGENIADSNGLKISLAASKKRHPTRGTDELFFISYAQIWCEIAGNSDIFAEDEHAPVSERVQSLDNIEDFRETFRCGTTDSCELW